MKEFSVIIPAGTVLPVNWNNMTYFYNFWNASMTSTSGQPADDQDSAVKTVYDPAPVGFTLPAGRAFTGFTTSGSNESDSTKFNVVGSFNKGWKFKRDSDDATGNYFPASGYRGDGSGVLASVSSYGGYWSFAPYSQANARNMGVSAGSVYPLNNDNSASAFAVRPCRESI